MSRNKVIFFILILVIAFFVLPDSGIYGTLKANLLSALPFVMMGIIIYLIVTINLLKRAWRKLDAEPNDENTIKFAQMMNITFDVKRMLGPTNLIELYRKVNFSPRVSFKAKRLLYDAMKRKRLDVPPPGEGADVDAILARSGRTPEEIKAARIAAAAQAKKKKRRKK